MMNYRDPARPAYFPPQGDQQQAQEAEPPKSGEAFTCQECGAELTDMDHRRKHAFMHWGTGNFPPFPGYNLARERYAALVGAESKGSK